MTDYIAESTKVVDGYLAALTTIQESLIEALGAFVKNFPELPRPAVDMPAVAEFSAAAFDVAEKALALHRTATDKLIADLIPAA